MTRRRSRIVPIALLLLAALAVGPPVVAAARTTRSGSKAPVAPPGVMYADTTIHSSEPLVYLTWHAPYGMPRASADLTPSQVPDGLDTLWLTFEPRRSERLYGMSAQLNFHAAGSDTLGEQWHFGGGTSNPRNIVIQFPQPSWVVKGPWTQPGYGGSHWIRENGAGKLDVLYAVNADSATAVDPARRYAFARILFPSMSAADARRPVCIEWVSGEIAFSIQDKATQPGRGGQPFASVASPDGAVCRPYVGARRLRPFKDGQVPQPKLPPGR